MNATEAKEALKKGERITAAAGDSKNKVFCKLCHGDMIMLVQPETSCAGLVLGVEHIDKFTTQGDFEIYTENEKGDIHQQN